jgi:hypothetical protein
VLLPALAAAPPPQGQRPLTPFQRPSVIHLTEVFLQIHAGFYTLHAQGPEQPVYPMQPMQSDLGIYPSQGSAFGSIPQDNSAAFGEGLAPTGMLSALQLPQAAGAGSWQPPPPLLAYSAPSSPAVNPAPYLRQGVPASLASSSSSIRQKLELPPLPRPLSSAAAAVLVESELKTEFRPSVYAAHNIIEPLSCSK